MSRGFVKEGDQEEIPMVLPRAFLPKGVPNYVTPEGLIQLRDEMETLNKEWTEAGSNYVLKNYVDAKIRLLSERINNAILIDPVKSNPEVVSFGMYVRYNDKIVRIVGVDEADTSKGLISFVSPIAKALIGKKKGDKFEIKVPRGMEVIEIQEVSISMSSELRAIDQSTKNNEQKAIKKDVVKTNIQTSETQLKKLTHELSETQFPNFSDSEKIHDTQTIAQSQDNQSSVLSSLFQPKVDITEFLPLVNEQGNIVGRALYCEIHNGNKVLHPAVHLLIYNAKKEIVGKYWWHVAFGETAEKTMKRMSSKLSPSLKPKFKKSYIRETKLEKELVSVFTTTYNGELIPTPHDKEWDAIFEKD